jgi:hypothetical protein
MPAGTATIQKAASAISALSSRCRCVSHSVARHNTAIGSAMLRVNTAATHSMLASANAAAVRLRAARNVAQNANPVSVSSSVSVMK